MFRLIKDIYQKTFSPNFNKEIERITSDRKIFNDFVYTSLEDALAELELRKGDQKIKRYINKTLNTGIPTSLVESGKMVFFRQLATPNYEMRRFVTIADALSDKIKPVFFEYHEDKFTDNNVWKYHLGKLPFYKGQDKHGNKISQKILTIDFTSNNGKRISEVKTLWGQSVIDFHHELFIKAFPHLDYGVFFDGSEWLLKNNGSAKHYYLPFLKLFLSHGILFENFMLDTKEIRFTKEIFLPAFIKIYRDTGKKPLVVALEPTEIEGDDFWMHHPHESMELVKNKLKALI
jgi:hypothetical protein